MLKQRFRERSEGWLSSSTDRFVHPHTPLSAETPNPPVSILTSHNNTSAAAATTTTLAATNGQLSTLPVIEHPPQLQTTLLQSQQQQERPRKKLSFRDPEVTSMAGKDAEMPSGAGGQPHLALLKDQGFSDSMENVDLEVSFFCSFVVGRRTFSEKEET